jgi:hypothetical protein
MTELQKLVINLDDALGLIQPFINHAEECYTNTYEVDSGCDCEVFEQHKKVYDALTQLKAEVFKI